MIGNTKYLGKGLGEPTLESFTDFIQLEDFNKPVLLALGRYDFIIAPASVWDPIRSKFQNLTVRIFERSGYSPHYEEAPLFENELLQWIEKKNG